MLQLFAPTGAWLREGWQSGVPTTCFDGDDHYDYYMCCRDVQLDGYPVLSDWCFGDEWPYEDCCSWGFGPSIRGLTHQCQLEPDGVARLFLGLGSVVEIQCSDPAHGPRRGATENIWFWGYLAARLLLNVSVLFTVDMWREARIIWDQRLVGQKSWRVLDVGSGVGVTSISLARAGHNVTAIDIDRYALRVLQKNARRNLVRVYSQTWDVFTVPDASLVERGPFDVVVCEGVSIVTQVQHEDPSLTAENLTDVAARFLHNLLPLRGKVFVMGGYYSAGHRKDPWKVDIASVALMRALKKFGQRPDLMVPCTGVAGRLCPRTPTMSPLGWHFHSGLGPHTAHALILW